MNKVSLFVEFMAPGPRSRVDDRYRILHPGRSGDLTLEKLEKDTLGGARWVTADLKEVLCKFEWHKRWEREWAKCSTRLNGRDSFLNTRFPGLPESSRGVVYSYSSRCDHDVDDEDQDVYVTTRSRGADFVTMVEHLIKVPDGKGSLVLLGALAILALSEQKKEEASDAE